MHFFKASTQFKPKPSLAEVPKTASRRCSSWARSPLRRFPRCGDVLLKFFKHRVLLLKKKYFKKCKKNIKGTNKSKLGVGTKAKGRYQCTDAVCFTSATGRMVCCSIEWVAIACVRLPAGKWGIWVLFFFFLFLEMEENLASVMPDSWPQKFVWSLNLETKEGLLGLSGLCDSFHLWLGQWRITSGESSRLR